MKTSSAKAKGRRFQQWVRDQLIEHLDVHPEDIESRSMGAGGEDLIMARAAREKFPYSIECKNQEKVNVWQAYAQAEDNSGDYEPSLLPLKPELGLMISFLQDIFFLLELFRGECYLARVTRKVVPIYAD